MWPLLSGLSDLCLRGRLLKMRQCKPLDSHWRRLHLCYHFPPRRVDLQGVFLLNQRLLPVQQQDHLQHMQ
jgi:hypothetical protein